MARPIPISTAKKIAFALLAIGLFFGASEALLRLLAPPLDLSFRFPEQNQQRRDPDAYAADPDLFWTLRPGARFFGMDDPINEHGYRGPALPADKPPGAFRLVTLGDSCTFGMEVPLSETYPEVTRRLLRERSRAFRVEVLNGGVPGYTSLQALRSLRRDLARFAPDAVTLYVGWNDINPALYLPDRDQGPWRIHAGPVRVLLERFRLYRDLTTLLYARAEPGPRVGEEDFAANLEAIDAFCRERGIVLVLMTLPTTFWSHPYNVLVRWWTATRDVPCLDLQAAMPWPREALFLADRTHPNGEGNRAISVLLADLLCECVPRLECAAAPFQSP